jgi:hypothetical protein
VGCTDTWWDAWTGRYCIGFGSFGIEGIWIGIQFGLSQWTGRAILDGIHQYQGNQHDSCWKGEDPVPRQYRVSKTLVTALMSCADNRSTSRGHHHTHTVMTHDWSFLQGDKRHNHTLKAGHHQFPFSLMLDGNLPSTINTYNGEANISYKLRANVVRSGFSSNFHTSRTFTLHRTYMNEALEFNQTLEIENTWPGKVMYSLTLPFKAYAAGDEIPVMLKFMPLAKGVRVMTVQSVLKEYTLVHTKHSQHSDQRVAASIKHELRNGKAYVVPETTARTPGRPAAGSSTAVSAAASTNPSTANSRVPSPSQTPRPGRTSSERPADSYFPSQSEGAGPSSGASVAASDDEDVNIGDDEINTAITIPIPAYTTPSHTIHPLFVTHKIKWSCSISNADGHVSELRCALPIIILNHSQLEEARSASAATRNLLFGNGNADETQVVDLPSYNNHVYDRVAVANSGQTSGFRSTHATPMHSPSSPTPPASTSHSRPSSPTRRHSTADGSLAAPGAAEVPPRRQLTSWDDSELLASLGELRIPSSHTSSPHDTPPDSRSPSRPLSRRNSRSGRSSRINSHAGSRAGSRASSPERSGSDMADRRVSSFTGLLHLGQSLKQRAHLPTKPILRTGSHFSPHTEMGRTASSSALSSGNHVRIGPTTLHNTGDDADEEEEADPISRVPSYGVASRGFLGGGITPLDTTLPTYDASEQARGADRGLIRPKSDTALVDMGRADRDEEM